MKDSYLGQQVQILDHGYLQYIEHWGSDERIIEAARMSTNKGFQGWGAPHSVDCPAGHNDEQWVSWAIRDCTCGAKPGDEKLLRYLYEHKHSTPFEMAGIVIEVQAPIFVLREWHRHRTQSYNEMSARYTPLPDVNYVPTTDRFRFLQERNKQAQGHGTQTLTPEAIIIWLERLRDSYQLAQETYEWGLDVGIPKELARLPVPVGRYSRMRASANLRNWLGFLTLRMDDSAQWETRQYANEVGKIIESLYPRTWELFVEGRASS